MTSLPLGLGAYRRKSAAAPEIQLVNRFLEAAPANPTEHTMLLTRPGTSLLAAFPPDTTTGKIRGCYSNGGSFNSDLFVVSGKNFYRYDGTTVTQIAGEIGGSGHPSVAFVKGIGYEHLFIADGTLLSYYGGTSHATGTVTWDGTTAITAQLVVVNGTYYGWNASVDSNSPDGSASHPFLCNPGSDALAAMANMLNFDGTPGTDFSTALTTPNADVTGSTNAGTDAATVLTLTAIDNTTTGNAITLAVGGTGGGLTASGATLSGGGAEALHGIAMPEGQPALVVASLDSYVFVAVAGTQKFYYVRPGETMIDELMFAEKESQPDPIIDMKTVGDMVIITGAASTEFWSATGDPDNPFAPIEGRTLSRGCIPGTLVVVNESTAVMVGNDYKVYMIGSTPQRISDNGIEERIRRQIRTEAGLT